MMFRVGLPAIFGLVLFLARAAWASNSYYVDASLGSDSNPGTSPAAAWASLKNINEHRFSPGDQILLHAGQSWNGTLEPHGNGTSQAPILLSRYGDGPKPVVRGEGADHTILLNDLNYWTVRDIAVTNHGEHVSVRNGIELHVAYAGVSTGLQLVGVDITDVNGEVGSKSSGGIGVMAWGKNGHGARFDGLLIDHCTIKHVDGQGIWFHVKGSKEGDDEDEGHDYPNTRIRITGTTIEDTGRNAIFLRDAMGALIDHNIVRSASARTHGNAVVVAWSKGTVLRENEVSDTGASGGGENGAFDADDGAVDTIIEYNWTHDNTGGSVNVVNDPRKHIANNGTVIRYNISENEHNSIFGIGGAVTATYIYNNTLFIGKGHSPKILEAGRFVSHVPGDPDGILFANNVIYGEGGGTYPISATHVGLDSNCYFGHVDFKQDQHKVTGDPGFDASVLPAKTWKDLEQYRLFSTSACAQAPVVKIPDGGTRNILGEVTGPPTRGAAGVR